MTTNLKKLGLTAIAATIISAFGMTAHAQTAGIITKNQAIDKAFSVNKGLLLDVELDDHKRTLVYDVKVLDGNTIYVYRINAVDGNVMYQKSEMINPQRAAFLNGVKVNYKDAEKAALAKYPNSQVYDLEIEGQRGQPVYKVHVTDESAMHHNVIVDAMTGAVLSASPCEYLPTKPALTRAMAEEKALASAPNAKVVKTQLDEDDGVVYYEVYMLANGNMLQKVKVDANTGYVFNKKQKKDRRDWK